MAQITIHSWTIVIVSLVCLACAAAQKDNSDDSISVLIEKIEDLEITVRDNRRTFENELAKQARKISKLEVQLSESQKKNGAERRQLQQSTQNGKSTLSHKYNRRQIGSSGVAFTAYMSKHADGLGHQDTVPFDSLILNEGQGFNTQSHTFTCPVTGVYTFQTALLSPLRSIALTEIVKEGVQLVQVHAEPGHTDGFDQGFNSVVTTCNKGQNVWVRNFKHYGTSIYSEKYTTFTGFLLWETEEFNAGIIG